MAMTPKLTGRDHSRCYGETLKPQPIRVVLDRQSSKESGNRLNKDVCSVIGNWHGVTFARVVTTAVV
jgi:hypothetical protein